MSVAPLDLSFPWGRVLCNPTWRVWLEERGYLSADGPPSDDPDRSVFFCSKRRSNATRSDGLDGVTVFDKSLVVDRARSVRDLLTRRPSGVSARHEFRMLDYARCAGIPVASPIAAIEHRNESPRVEMLVTEALAGRALADLVADPSPPMAEARTIAAAVGRTIARLHECGLSFPSLFAKHAFVDLADEAPVVGFLDLADATTRSAPSRTRRAQDLAALAATLPRWPVRRSLRLAALRSYLAASNVAWPLRDMWREIGANAATRARRRRFRRFLATAPVPPLQEHLPEPGLRVTMHGTATLEDLEDAGDGWTQPEGDELARLCGSADEVWRVWSALRLFHAFDVAGARPVAHRALDENRATLLACPWTASPRPVDPEVGDFLPDLLELTRALWTAGLIPRRGFVDTLRRDDAGRLHLAPDVPLDAPTIVRSRTLAASIRVLCEDLEAHGVSDAAVRDVRAAWPSIASDCAAP